MTAIPKHSGWVTMNRINAKRYISRFQNVENTHPQLFQQYVFTAAKVRLDRDWFHISRGSRKFAVVYNMLPKSFDELMKASFWSLGIAL